MHDSQNVPVKLNETALVYGEYVLRPDARRPNFYTASDMRSA